MDITMLGGGPAGLYVAILMKKADPSHRITVLERNRPDDTFGWGVVFSDETLAGFREADAESFDAITQRFAHWTDIDIHFRGRTIRSGGHGFAGIARVELLQLLQARATELGVDIRYETEVEPSDLARLRTENDLIVAADGVNSKTRTALADHFRPTITPGASRFMWLGTRKLLPAFTFIVVESEHGLFTVHGYRFNATTSTFIVETDEASWRRAGLDEKSTEESVATCEELFAPWLGGERLLSNRASWIRFPEVKNASWRHENVVLLGDAAHTAHFSIGSGTKLAMEDSIALAAAFAEHGHDVPTALAAYEDTRRLGVAKIQHVAARSQRWFEEMPRHARLAPDQFAFSLLSRSSKITHENLRLRDPAYVGSVDRAFATSVGVPATGPTPPPLFCPFELRGLRLPNRVVVSPMCTYSAEDGVPGDWHLVHLGSRAVGGAGLVMAEMTEVSPEGRITTGCTGLWTDEQGAAWKRIVGFVHGQTPAAIGIQLGHAGRKASARKPWEGPDAPLAGGGWEALAPSPLPWAPGWPTPRAAERADLDRLVAAYVAAARRAAEAGFDLLEIHAAHGYLLASFLSPLTNQRTDDYGGSREKRFRFPLEIVEAVREAWPEERPLSVRLSAVDWLPGGVTIEDSVELARALAARGVDVVDVSSGFTTPEAKPEIWGRMFQVPFAERIRNEANVPTLTVGNVLDADHVNTILAAGRADLCALARPHLADPYLTLHAATDHAWPEHPWPKQYLLARPDVRRPRTPERASGGPVLRPRDGPRS